MSGVSLDCTSLESNMLEQHYPHRNRITCAGIGEGGEVERTYPGVKFQQIKPHEALPFGDGQFDVAYSNAVMEHVGSRGKQQAFVRELCRVARAVFLVVPNRWFPVEHHTAIPLIHFLPLPLFRGLLRCTPLRHWGLEENLNPVSASQVARFFPAGRVPEIRYVGLGVGFTRSNILAIAR